MKWLSLAWRGWRWFGRLIGDAVARVILTLFHFTVFVPFALVTRLSTRPLELRGAPRWVPRQTYDRSLSDARRLSNEIDALLRMVGFDEAR